MLSTNAYQKNTLKQAGVAGKIKRLYMTHEWTPKNVGSKLNTPL